MNIVPNSHTNTGSLPCRRYPAGVPAVLIVDDDPRVGDVLLELFESEGFHVSYANSGQRALKCIEQNHPQVVLADMRMPAMDGVTLLQEITHRWDDIEVIMMSATESPVGLSVPFIQKPFDLDNVISVICDGKPDHSPTATKRISSPGES